MTIAFGKINATEYLGLPDGKRLASKKKKNEESDLNKSTAALRIGLYSLVYQLLYLPQYEVEIQVNSDSNQQHVHAAR